MDSLLGEDPRSNSDRSGGATAMWVGTLLPHCCRRPRAAGLLAVITIVAMSQFGCAPSDSKSASGEAPTVAREFISPESHSFEEVRVEGIPGVSDLFYNARLQEYAILSSKASKVVVLSGGWHPVAEMGEPGMGPGEFHNPVSVAMDDSTILVAERSGRVHLLDRHGLSRGTIPSIGVLHMGSFFHIDRKEVYLGGLKEVAGEPYGGLLIHVYARSGELLRRFGQVSPMAERYKVSSVVGIACDMNGEYLYCIQPTDYSVEVFDVSGSLLRTVRVQDPEFTKLSRPQPEESDAFIKWVQSWDRALKVYSLSPSRILVLVVDGANASQELHLVNLDSGTITRKFESSDWIVDYLKEEGTLVTLGESPLESVATTLRLYSLHLKD